MDPRQSDDRKNDFFKKRFAEFKEEAIELSDLCGGDSLGFICYGPGNEEVHVWPENRQALKQIVDKFKAQSDQQKKENSCSLLDDLSAEELREHLSVIRSQLAGIRQKKIEILKKTMIKGSSSSDPSDIVPPS